VQYDKPYNIFLLAVCVLMCQNTKKEFYKKFLYEPLPVEVCIPQAPHLSI